MNQNNSPTNTNQSDHQAARPDLQSKRELLLAGDVPPMLFCVRCGYPMADTRTPERCPQCGHRPCLTCGE